VIVLDAIAAFGSQLRLELVRHYRRTPSTQADAARALGVQKRSVSNNTAELVRTGVIAETSPDEDSARTIYTVDQARLKELLTALDRYARGKNPPGT
jgi:DNA-binding MarR family transcriptional regulator